MLTNLQLVAFCKKALDMGAKYWYGTCWYKGTEDLLNRKAKQYPAHYTASRMKTYRKHIQEGRMVCDCVGLIKGFFWTGNGTQANKYRANNCPDTSADGMIKLCEKTWPVAEMPDVPGNVLWRKGHIGVYIGDGWAIEARGFNYGVVKTKVAGRGWKKAGRLPAGMLVYVDADMGDDKEAVPEETPLLKRGMEGEAVERMQQKLLIWNKKCLPVWGADGEFGKETYNAVRKFQRAYSLGVDGIVGPKTWAALLDVEAAAHE